MKPLMIWIFIMTLVNPLFGQDRMDSIQHLLDKKTSKDSVRVNLLNRAGYEFWTVDPVKSEQLGLEALAISDSIKYQPGKAFAERVIGVAHWAQGNYEDGLSFLMESLLHFQQLEDTLNIANVMMNTGLIYHAQDRYEEALSYYLEALQTFQYLHRPRRELNTANHIGELYQSQKNYEQALRFYHLALHLSDSVGSAYGKSTAYQDLGRLYKEMGKLDSALQFCHQALEIQENQTDRHGRASSLYTIGLIYQAKQDYSRAEQTFSESLVAATQISSKKLQSDIYFQLKEVAEAQGKFLPALRYFERYVEVNDSLFNADKVRDITRLENQLTLEKKERKVQQQQQQLEIVQQQAALQQYIRNGLILLVIILAFLGYLIFSRQKLKIRKNKELIGKNKQIYQSEKALAASQLEKAHLLEKKLMQDLEYKNKELTSYTINFMQKNELLEKLQETIKEIGKKAGVQTARELKSLSRLVESNMHQERDWEDFKFRFEEVHKDFFRILHQKYPELTSNELRLCALLKLNLNLKESASIMGISPESVKTARYRLRKKLQISREENLVNYMIHLESEGILH